MLAWIYRDELTLPLLQLIAEAAIEAQDETQRYWAAGLQPGEASCIQNGGDFVCNEGWHQVDLCPNRYYCFPRIAWRRDD